ncbi:uroporphyrinogen-III synthase [Pelagibacterium lentulum]|uniref:Uroporphyrinogen-III synthase n=1 Tax=Pelagibacterium lentulum TaxID=2029865 RepID=A0A916R609_9HYPH|nr:uroporphyrinogen-III synthase [Pelagibacterium lentulum]GGA36224.1 uroporphyrinogen III methyltransferase [Pelagibacterium lentulum]
MDRPRLLVTRPQPDADRTAGHLRALEIEPIIAPLLRAEPREGTIPDLSAFGALAITSANAARFLARELDGLDGAAPWQLPVFTVGDHSAHEARQAGFTNVISAQGTLNDLAHLIETNRPDGTVFYPAAHHQSGDLAGLLARSGISTRTEVLYEMVAAEALAPEVAETLIRGEVAGILFYSRRTAQIFAELCKGDDFDPVRRQVECLCVSESCAQPLIDNHFLRISLADDPDHGAMMSLALAFAREQISP